MLGAITGDIVGSVYEWNNIRTKEFELLKDECFFTDDSVMTIAVADAIMACKGDYAALPEKTVESMQKFGRRYPNSGYGGRFGMWLLEDDPQPYNSWGNGSAMRVSPCGFAAKSLEEAENLAEITAAVTHNHPEGIKGAKATAGAVFLAKSGKTMDEIREYVNGFYDINFTLDEIRPTYKFNESCMDTIPQALEAFFEAKDFEDAIRNAISIGGDSDTLAAITGGVAEAYFGIPEEIKSAVLDYLTDDLREVYNSFLNFTESN